jgi:hypothetical protein
LQAVAVQVLPDEAADRGVGVGRPGDRDLVGELRRVAGGRRVGGGGADGDAEDGVEGDGEGGVAAGVGRDVEVAEEELALLVADRVGDGVAEELQDEAVLGVLASVPWMVMLWPSEETTAEVSTGAPADVPLSMPEPLPVIELGS